MQLRFGALLAASCAVVVDASRQVFLSSGGLTSGIELDTGAFDKQLDTLAVGRPSVLMALNKSTADAWALASEALASEALASGAAASEARALLSLNVTPSPPAPSPSNVASSRPSSPVPVGRVLEFDTGIQGLVYHPRHRSHIIRHWHRPKDCGDACKGLIDYEMALQETSSSLVVFWFLFVIPLLIWLLGTTAQHFFVPSLLDWSKRLGMQPEIAGATLLALGASAPDVFSAVLAAEAQDLPLALSELLGANMFNLCINGGMVILAAAYYLAPAAASGDENAPEAVEAQKAAERATKEQNSRLVIPIGMLFVTICTMALIFFGGRLAIWKALVLPAIYGIYVGLLSLRSRSAEAAQEEPERDESPPICAASSGGGGGPDAAAGTPPPPPPLEGLAMPKDVSPLGFVFWLLALPFYVVRWASIPPSDGVWDQQRRVVSACAPFAMIFLFMMCAPDVDTVLGRGGFAAMLLFGAILSVGVFASSGSGPDLPWFYPALTLFAGVSSVLWLGGVANELTALIEGIGFVLKVPRLRLGFILIAWGNAAADILICYAMARRGRFRTAFNAVFSNPLVADWLGLGATLLIVVRGAGGTSAKVWEGGCPPELQLPLAVCFSGLFGAAALHGARLACGGGSTMKSAKMWAGFLFVWYVVFVGVIFNVSGVATPGPGESTVAE